MSLLLTREVSIIQIIDIQIALLFQLLSLNFKYCTKVLILLRYISLYVWDSIRLPCPYIHHTLFPNNFSSFVNSVRVFLTLPLGLSREGTSTHHSRPPSAMSSDSTGVRMRHTPRTPSGRARVPRPVSIATTGVMSQSLIVEKTIGRRPSQKRNEMR